MDSQSEKMRLDCLLRLLLVNDDHLLLNAEGARRGFGCSAHAEFTCKRIAQSCGKLWLELCSTPSMAASYGSMSEKSLHSVRLSLGILSVMA
jgi:hypothetical protein